MVQPLQEHLQVVIFLKSCAEKQQANLWLQGQSVQGMTAAAAATAAAAGGVHAARAAGLHLCRELRRLAAGQRQSI
jgi:hypothetical protein